ncbi:MAG: glutamate synthase-related protein [Candidatus Methanosuratincola petrocarbonis]
MNVVYAITAPIYSSVQSGALSATYGIENAIDTTWILVAAFLVFFMNLGFAMLESGMQRAKNTSNICMKNLVTPAIGGMAFFIVGFSLAFGTDILGFLGNPTELAILGQLNALDIWPNTNVTSYAYFLFQIMFAATAATIVSGAVGERIKFIGYIIFTVTILTLTYPLVAHWVWGGGWLASIGMIDFAGSAVVHLTGGAAALAVARATSRVGIPTNTGEGGMLPEEREAASILIAQYASGRFGVSAEYLRSADAVEIKIGQGAKGGQGGLLMGEKVTEEVAKVRGLPPGSDAISPARHLDIVGPEDLKMKIEQLREITDWKVPIIVKYSAGRVGDDVKIAAKAGADVIVIDGKQGGTGAAPDIVIEHAGLPTLPALVEAERSLRELGVKDKVSLVISGGIRNGADIAKALALGADAVAISTGVLIAMGCRTCGLCSTGRCPRGITTQDPVLRKRLKVEEMAARVENYLRAIIEELKMFTQLSGKTSVRSLEKDDLRAITADAAAITGVKLVGA